MDNVAPPAPLDASSPLPIENVPVVETVLRNTHELGHAVATTLSRPPLTVPAIRFTPPPLAFATLVLLIVSAPNDVPSSEVGPLPSLMPRILLLTPSRTTPAVVALIVGGVPAAGSSPKAVRAVSGTGTLGKSATPWPIRDSPASSAMP